MVEPGRLRSRYGAHCGIGKHDGAAPFPEGHQGKGLPLPDTQSRLTQHSNSEIPGAAPCCGPILSRALDVPPSGALCCGHPGHGRDRFPAMHRFGPFAQWVVNRFLALACPLAHHFGPGATHIGRAAGRCAGFLRASGTVR
jgi:hypothetical protein